MRFVLISLLIILFIALLVLTISFICFRMAFYSPKRKNIDPEAIDIPPGEIYEPFREQMVNWILEARKIGYKEFTAVSFDGLRLYGRYFEYSPDSPIELMFPGYHGVAERDLCGGVQRCFALGRSALIVDQRGCGKSDGTVITFGNKESRDVLSWIDIIKTELGNNRKIILTGISMGAATVLTACRYKLPKEVVGIIADCPFTTPEAIIKKVIKDMKLPPKLCYPFVTLGAFIFGHFRLNEASALKSVKNCNVPVFLAHGTKDDYVPYEMSEELYKAITSEKLLLPVKGAGHGLAYLVAPVEYIESLRKIESEYIKKDS